MAVRGIGIFPVLMIEIQVDEFRRWIALSPLIVDSTGSSWGGVGSSLPLGEVCITGMGRERR